MCSLKAEQWTGGVRVGGGKGQCGSWGWRELIKAWDVYTYARGVCVAHCAAGEGRGQAGGRGQLSPFPPFCISGLASEESEISKLNLAVMKLYSSRKRIEHLKKTIY